MADEFINYRSFNDKAVAISLYEKFKQQGFAVEWESTVGIFDASFANDEFMHLYYVKLRKEDFAKADEMMMESVKESSEPSPDYYLYTFTENELIDVLKNPDEWNEYDRFWATRLLEKKNVHVKKEDIIQNKEEKLTQLKKPWNISKIWLLGPLVLLLWGLYFLNFIITVCSLVIGIIITYNKKTMPDGERVMAFSADNRFLGKIVMITSAVITAFILLIYFNIINMEWYLELVYG